LVIGNPPFGQQNSLAVRFINHAATFADTIAFIVPLSFKKDSVKNMLNPNLHLRSEVVLPKNSFTLEGEDMDVPCVFQIWDYKKEARVKPAVVKVNAFSFVSKLEAPDLYIQRVGGRAGHAGTDWADRSAQSNYFVKVDLSIISPAKLVDLVNGLKFPSKDWSVGPRSLSKQELLSVLVAAKPSFKA
jgi:hypothetical protein